MMNAKNFLTKTFLFVALIAVATFTSCKVGLGAAVDTLAPTVSISTPAVNDIKSGEFQITGFASDDRGLRDVIVNLVDNGVTKYVYLATIDSTTNQWNVTIPTLYPDKTPAVVDAKYEIKVIATDKDGKSSVATRAIQVDNTAPTVLLTSPSLFDENKSTFFRQLRVSGSCYDVSEISSVKVYFYKEGETSTDLTDASKYKVYQAEGTNTWELSKDIDANDTFFANNTVYNFFVVAEDVAGNKNTYFYRMGDFYSKGILKDSNPDDGDDYIPFPSMMQIGKFDQGDTVENPTSGLTKENLYKIRTQCKSIKENNSNFLYRSESASNISWGNIEYSEKGEIKAIPLEMDINGQIKSTDGTDILPDSIEVYLRSDKIDGGKWWKISTENVSLDISGRTVAFTITLKKDNQFVKSGNYNIKIKYKTVASINATPLESDIHNFAISAGMPVLTERNLSGNETSPISLQVYSNKDVVTLSGKALKGDRTPAEKLLVKINDVEATSPAISTDPATEGEWSFVLKEEGTYTIELSVGDDGVNTTSLNRTVIIDRTLPKVENASFAQNAAKTEVTATAFVTDENSLEKIEYAFVQGDSVEANQWETAENKSSLNVTIKNANGFTQGPWSLFIKATDKAGNVHIEKADGVLDLDAPEFVNFVTGDILSSGYVNGQFNYLKSDMADDVVIAEDKIALKKIEIVAKKDGQVISDYGYIKDDINKMQLTRGDLTKLPSIIANGDNAGKWIITYTLYDKNNNKAEKTVDFVIDVTKPTIEVKIFPNKENDSSTSDFEFKGTASDDVSGVSKIGISLDKQNWTEFDGQKSWNKTLSIKNEGEGTVYAYAIDGANNKTEIVEQPFTFDKAYPEITLGTGSSFYTGTNFEINGTISDSWGFADTAIEITQYKKVNEELTDAITLVEKSTEKSTEKSIVKFDDENKKSGTWNLGDLPRNSEGTKIEKDDIPTATYVYRIVVTDKAEKSTTTDVTVSIDKTKPSKNEIQSPNSKIGKNAIDSDSVSFFGVAEDNDGEAKTGIEYIEYAITNVKVNTKEQDPEELTKIETSGSWEFIKHDFTEGQYFLYVRAVDKAGNKSEFIEEEFHVDFSNPTLEVTTQKDKTNQLFNLSGTSDKKGLKTDNPIKISQQPSVGETLSFYVGVNDGNWTSGNLPVKKTRDGVVVSIDDDESEKINFNGTYTYKIEVTDWCGKTTEKTVTVKFDTKAPEVEISNIEDNTTFTTDNITVKGSVEDDSKLEGLYWNLSNEKYEISAEKPFNVADFTPLEPTPTISWKIDLKDEIKINKEYWLNIVAVDEPGNISEVYSRCFYVDTKDPEVEILNIEDGTNFTASTFTVSGTATDNVNLASVEIKVGQEESQTVNVKEDDTWNYPIENLDSDVLTSVTVTAKDKAGNSTSKSFNVYKDTKAPEVVLKNLSDNLQITKLNDDGTYTVNGSWSENGGSGFASLEYSLNGTDWSPINHKNETNWSVNIPLAQAIDKVISFKATDKEGNSKETTIYGVDIDTETPKITVESSADDVIKQDSNPYTITVTATDSLELSKIVVSANNTKTSESKNLTITSKDVTNGSEKSWVWVYTLDKTVANEGQWNFSIYSEDTVGHQSSVATTSVLMDITSPSITKAAPATDSNCEEIGGKKWFKTQSINFAGEIKENIEVEKVEYSTDGGTTWTQCTSTGNTFKSNIYLKNEGESTIYFRATDTAGNVSEEYKVSDICIDVSVPTIDEVISPTGSILLNGESSLEIEVKVSDNGSGVHSVKATIGEKDVTGTIAGNIATISIPFDEVDFRNEIGQNRIIYVQVEDKVGNLSARQSLNFDMDTEKPEVVITSHTSGDTVNKEITLSGKTTETQGLATVDLYVNGNLIKPVNSEHTFKGNAGFNWEYKIDTEGYTDNKALNIEVVATDNAGNIGKTTITLNVDQKSDRPIITVREIGLSGEQYLGQKTISFTVEDDDGLIEKLEISEDNSNWNPAELKNGSYNYTLVDDGDYELSFRVTEYKEKPDSPDVVFVTSSEKDALTEPVLEHETEVSDSTLKFTLDTKNPEIKPGSTISFDEGTSSKFDNGIKIGGAKKAFTINVGVKDASEIQAVVLKVGENFTKEGSLQPGAADENGFETWKITISETECEKFDNGNVQFDLEVKDNAGSTTKVTKVLLVDNEKPSITVESPTNMTQVTSSVRISGSTTDDVNEDKDVTSSGISSVKYLITELTNVYDGSTLKSGDEIINLSEWQDVNGTSYWNFSINVDDYVKKENDEWTSNFAFEKGNDIFELPIFFLITDNVGNQHLEIGYSLLLDPEGDKPVASITYPTDRAILGGQIRVFGTADDNINVTDVYMQIDINGDKDFTYKSDSNKEPYDKTYDGNWLADQKNTKNEPLYNIVELSDGDWGIKLNGTSSWNLLINTTDEFTNARIEKISLRVKAFDGEKYGNWTDWIDITIDGEAPKIGSHVPPRLVQYDESGNEIASVQYVADMWISGDWYLETSVMDNEGIGSIETKESNFNDLKDISILGNDEYIAERVEGSKDEDSGYIIKLPLKTSGKTEGNISFKISAIEKSDQNITSTYPISIKYDNSAPTLDGKLYSSKQEIGLGEGKNTIQDSDGQYEISSTVKEAGSGFQRLAVYFVREDSNGNKRIYNPRYAKETNGNKVNISKVGEREGKVSGNVYIDKKDGLPRLYINDATIKDGSIISYPGLKDNPNIYEGRIVRIKGVDRKITSISGDEATFTPEISAGYNADNVEAEFAYALIVDNFMKDKISDNDEATQDGDYIEETIIKTGEKYDCSLIFNSKNIPDGPITICYVAYDEAGNCSVLEEPVKTKIENNPPAIAKVWLGTNLNGDTEITEDEEVIVYGANYNPETFDPLATENRNISIDATTKFTAKDETTIRADIVGGNNALYYYFGYYSKIEEKEIENVFENHNAKELSKLDNGNYRITLTSDDLKSFDDNPGDFFVEYWDATEETIYNDSDKSKNTSQWAKMKVTFMVDVVDEEPPTVKIDDLYWNSKSDNSIVKTEKGENDGHIDLSDDLPEEFKESAESSGVMDRDDKVSGKIIFKGTVSDNVRLSNLNFTFEKEETEDKTDPYITETLFYDSVDKTWYVVKDGVELKLDNQCVSKDGYELKLDNSTLDQNGHNVTWTLTIDTEKNGIVAAADVNLVVEAVDHTEDTDNNKASERKRVDVVPYITGVQTSLSALDKRNPTAVTRSALGKYTVQDGEEVTLTGFNLGETTKYTVSQSGDYSHTVNEITALNNLNDNDAHGTYTGELNQDNYSEYAYNRQPNDENNNLLTDDISFAVWQFDEDAVVPKSGRIEQPIMKINPISNKVGFAFVNGPLYFSMGEGGENGHSYQYWMGSFDFFTSVGFTYDSLGYSYGVAAGGDINATEADKFQLMSSRWGIAERGQKGSYSNTNSLRLESIGMKRDGTNYYDKQRIKSPALATTVTKTANSSTTSLYLAYYDAMNDEIRFKAGSTSSTTKRDFGNFKDYDTSTVPYEYRTGTVSMIAGSKTGRKAGEYISIGAIPDAKINVNHDVVVVVWYGADRTLWYSYTTSSPMDRERQTDGTGWSIPKSVFPSDSDMANAGEYCKVVVDNAGGIHVAAYDPVNLDLCYAYLSSYDDGAFETCVVDSNGVTGSNLTLDVAKVGDNWVPYIGYYATSYIKPKYAYKVSTEKAPAGSKDDMFTQDWESMIVPTSSTIEMQSNQHNDINIGVWKGDDGSLKESKPGTNSHNTNNDGYSKDAYGDVYGNGTSNPIMGYVIKAGASKNTIETAQLK